MCHDVGEVVYLMYLVRESGFIDADFHHPGDQILGMLLLLEGETEFFSYICIKILFVLFFS